MIDKPGGMTSRDVVNRVQGQLPRGTRIGHTGTLDPLATGVLVLCLGSATRLAEYVQATSKTYRAGLLLGQRSDTEDADGVITTVEGVRRRIGDPPRCCNCLSARSTRCRQPTRPQSSAAGGPMIWPAADKP